MGFRLGAGLSLSSYRREWLVRDVVAGGPDDMLVPQGMTYAELAGLPLTPELAGQDPAEPQGRGVLR